MGLRASQEGLDGIPLGSRRRLAVVVVSDVLCPLGARRSPGKSLDRALEVLDQSQQALPAHRAAFGRRSGYGCPSITALGPGVHVNVKQCAEAEPGAAGQ